MTSKTETAMIRSKLQLRLSPESSEYEIYTTMHGSGIFRWYIISEETARWYSQVFNINMPTMQVQENT